MDNALPCDSKLLELMPKLFRDLARAVPIPGLLELAEKCGGTRIYVPAEPDDRSRLGRTLGRGASFDALCREYRGQALEIPLAERLRKSLRNGEIVALCVHGASVRALAIKFRLTERSIFRILAKAAVLLPSSRPATVNGVVCIRGKKTTTRAAAEPLGRKGN